MLARAIRSVLRRLGIRLPFAGVICPEWNKTIYIEGDWRARVVTSRTLVFTDNPQPGDLSDPFPIEPGSPTEVLFYESPDATEVSRRRRDPHTLVISWMPNARVTRYALYHHEDNWVHPVSHKRSAIAAHYRCDLKTGTFGIDFITPGSFEAGVAFRPPRWKKLRSERSLMKHALAELHAPAAVRPRIEDGGRRAGWRVDGPRLGDGFVFVLFHEHGVVEWERRIEESTLVGRAKRLISHIAHPARS